MDGAAPQPRAVRSSQESRDASGIGGVGFLLGLAHRARRRRWEASLADVGLTAPQAAVLRLVADEPGCGVRQLARRLGTDPMNVQRITDFLVAKGLCTSGRDLDDARRRPLRPTGRGEELARDVAARARAADEELVVLLGRGAYDELVDALSTLVAYDSDAGRRGERG